MSLTTIRWHQELSNASFIIFFPFKLNLSNMQARERAWKNSSILFNTAEHASTSTLHSLSSFINIWTLSTQTMQRVTFSLSKSHLLTSFLLLFTMLLHFSKNSLEWKFSNFCSRMKKKVECIQLVIIQIWDEFTELADNTLSSLTSNLQLTLEGKAKQQRQRRRYQKQQSKSIISHRRHKKHH